MGVLTSAWLTAMPVVAFSVFREIVLKVCEILLVRRLVFFCFPRSSFHFFSWSATQKWGLVELRVSTALA